MSEKRIMQQVMKALSDAGARLFRNHVGVAYQGEVERYNETTSVTVNKGDVIIRRARTVKAGLVNGSSDLIGWHPRVITEYDLGKTLAIFCACEVKTESGELTDEQRNFLDVVKDSGGVAIVARSAEQARSELNGG